MQFERQNAFQNAYNYIFSRIKSVTRNTLIFLFGLGVNTLVFCDTVL